MDCHWSSQLLEYVIGEMEDDEKEVLAKHVQSCDMCRQELENLQKAWQAIPLELDEVDVPADLKAEVMGAIFPPETTKPQAAPWWKQVWTGVRLRPQTVVTTFLLLAVGALGVQNLQLHRQLQAFEHQGTAPAQVLQVYALRPADPVMQTAKGNVWLMQQGSTKKLVLHMQGLEVTKGEEAYQVWLIHEGKRRSAGVFLVDEQGNGVLTYELQAQQPPFEAIGITLEPDANGQQPRGKKVLGT